MVPFGVGFGCGGKGLGVEGWWECGELRVGHEGIGGEPRGWGEVVGFGVGVGVGGVSVRGPVRVASWGVFGSGSRKLYFWVI